MRVVLYEPAGRGGVCHYTHELAEHLARAGADVTLFTTEDYELEHLARSFRVRYLFRRSWFTRASQAISRFRRGLRAPAIRREEADRESTLTAAAVARRPRPMLLRRLRLGMLHLRVAGAFLVRRPDVVHFQWFADRVQDSRFIRLLRGLRIPVVYTAHDVEPHSAATDRDRADLRRIYRSVSGIVVHAESNKRELVTRFDVDSSKVAVIPHGSYDLLCSPEALSPEAARAKVSVPADRKVVLFFGLIKRYKGLEYLVEAFARVRALIPDAFLLVVGDIYKGDLEGYRDYTRLVEDLRKSPDVLCIASYVPLDRVGYYLAAADVVVLPYTRTYQSGVLLAAYAAGRPVVVTKTGGLGEVVEDGRTGYVVAPENAGELADAIVRVLADPDRRREMGRRARELATSRYGWEAVAARTITFYGSLVGNGRGTFRKRSGDTRRGETSPGAAGSHRPSVPSSRIRS